MEDNSLLMIVLAFILGYMCSVMMKQMCGGRLVEGAVDENDKNLGVMSKDLLDDLSNDGAISRCGKYHCGEDSEMKKCLENEVTEATQDIHLPYVFFDNIGDCAYKAKCDSNFTECIRSDGNYESYKGLFESLESLIFG